MFTSITDIILVFLFLNREKGDYKGRVNLSEYLKNDYNDKAGEVKRILRELERNKWISVTGIDFLGNSSGGRRSDFTNTQVLVKPYDLAIQKAEELIAKFDRKKKLHALVEFYASEHHDSTKLVSYTVDDLRRIVFKNLLLTNEVLNLVSHLISNNDLVKSVTGERIEISETTAEAFITEKYLTNLIVSDEKTVGGHKVQLPPLDNEQTFEDFVLDLLNAMYPDALFQHFGKRGNRQYGIDLLSARKEMAIQCKKKEITGKRLVEVLKGDFRKDALDAMTSKINLKVFIFTSTFDNNAEISSYLVTLKLEKQIPFDLAYLGWQSLSGEAQNHPHLMRKYWPTFFQKKSFEQDNRIQRNISIRYLDNLPKVKYNAYMQGHKLWDTGVTAQMIGGNELLYDKLMEILVALTEEIYGLDYFKGQTAYEFYTKKINRMMRSAYDSQPIDGGTMHLVIASGQSFLFADELIVEIVRSVTTPEYYSEWISKWMFASVVGGEGREIELDTTDEL